MKRLKARLRVQVEQAGAVRAERAIEKQKKRMRKVTSADALSGEQSSEE